MAALWTTYLNPAQGGRGFRSASIRRQSPIVTIAIVLIVLLSIIIIVPVAIGLGIVALLRALFTRELPEGSTSPRAPSPTPDAQGRENVRVRVTS